MTPRQKVAALYVETGGAYFGLEGVDPWDAERDARAYPGPHPVVAHPPCTRWGGYWAGSPGNPNCGKEKMGDDGQCFGAALWAVRTFGGVIEHPKGSHAWSWHGLIEPLPGGGWTRADSYGWTCCVYQGRYGHRAAKGTWLYAVGVDLPSLRWGKVKGETTCENLCRQERRRTPEPFKDLLLNMARSVNS